VPQPPSAGNVTGSQDMQAPAMSPA
jgi:hypothetical protein